VTAILACCISGCANLGQAPLWPRIQSASVAAVKQKSVWVPLASAAVIGVVDADDSISDWAVEHTPVFGSASAAEDAANQMVESLMVSALVSTLVSESDHGDRFKSMAVNGLSLVVNQKVTRGVKGLVKRKRPTRLSDQSFPSLHTSRAFAAAEITARNLARISLHHKTKDYLQAGVYTLASATAWARLEERAHYPTDVLVGAALGSFIVGVFNEAFLREESSATLSFQPVRDGAAVSLHWQPYR